MEENKQLVVFKGKQIRRVIYADEWHFAVVDVIEALIDSPNPTVYWRVLKHRLKKEGSDETVTNCNGLKMTAKDGKERVTDCANTETRKLLSEELEKLMVY